MYGSVAYRVYGGRELSSREHAFLHRVSIAPRYQPVLVRTLVVMYERPDTPLLTLRIYTVRHVHTGCFYVLNGRPLYTVMTT